jgi:nucleoid-associated protein Lsr2
MPRSTEQILAHADELARRFAEHEPADDRIMDARTLRDIAAAVERRAVAERDIAEAVTVARAEGHTWAAIAAMLGTSGEAARQRYSSPTAYPTHGGGQPWPGYSAGSRHPQEAGLAQRITVVLEDDLEGGPADETVRFGFGGADYEIDLSKKNATALRKQLAPFIEHARKAGRAQPRRPGRTAASQRSGDIRAWAKEHGLAVSERGRIPASVVEQYNAAGGR